jgi:hypothetical protein
LAIGCGTFRISGAITRLILEAALEARLDKLCEIIVIEQELNAGGQPLCRTPLKMIEKKKGE